MQVHLNPSSVVEMVCVVKTEENHYLIMCNVAHFCGLNMTFILYNIALFSMSLDTYQIFKNGIVVLALL